MTYEECMSLVEAYDQSVALATELASTSLACKSIANNIRDNLGEFIGSLLYESPIGDGGQAKHMVADDGE